MFFRHFQFSFLLVTVLFGALGFGIVLKAADSADSDVPVLETLKKKTVDQAIEVPTLGNESTDKKTDDFQAQELFSKGITSSTGFGGPSARFTQVAGKGTMLMGGRGGWLINHSFLLGGAGYGLVIPVTTSKSAGSDLRMGYGGLLLEYAFFPESLFHMALASIVGFGGVHTEEKMNGSRGAFFVFEPEISFYLNLAYFTRLAVSFSYRFASQPKEYASAAELSNFNAGLSIYFGRF